MVVNIHKKLLIFIIMSIFIINIVCADTAVVAPYPFCAGGGQSTVNVYSDCWNSNISVNYTFTLPAGVDAYVTNVGNGSSLFLDFFIPRGSQGLTGEDGYSSTIDVNATFTVPYGSAASVVNVGSDNDALLDISIPQGMPGTDGINGLNGTDGINGLDNMTMNLTPNMTAGINGLNNMTMNLTPNMTMNQTANMTAGINGLNNMTMNLTPNMTMNQTANMTAGPIGQSAYVYGNVSEVLYNIGGNATTSPCMTFNNTTGLFTACFLSGDGTDITNVTANAVALSFNVREGGIGNIYKGQAVYISGSTGVNVRVLPADNTATDSSRVVGLMIQDVTINGAGQVRRAGELVGVDTRTTNLNVNPNGETWAAGDLLFATTGGGLTNIRPTSGRSVKVAYSLRGSHISDTLLAYPLENPVWVTAASGENVITRLGDSIGVNKLSIRNYVNAEVAFINSYGNATVQGLNATGVNISNVADPVANQDVATKHYVDTTGANMTPGLNNMTMNLTPNMTAGTNGLNNMTMNLTPNMTAGTNGVNNMTMNLTPNMTAGTNGLNNMTMNLTPNMTAGTNGLNNMTMNLTPNMTAGTNGVNNMTMNLTPNMTAGTNGVNNMTMNLTPNMTAGTNGLNNMTMNLTPNMTAGTNGLNNMTMNLTPNMTAGTNGVNNMTMNLTPNMTINQTFNLTANMTAGTNGLNNMTMNLTPNMTINQTANMTAGTNGLNNMTMNLTPNMTVNLTPNMTINQTFNLTPNMTAGTNGLNNMTMNLTANMTMNQTANMTGGSADMTWNVTYPLLNGDRLYTGNIDMARFNVSNITSVTGGDAVNKTYVDFGMDANSNNTVIIESDFFDPSTQAIPGFLGAAISSGTVGMVATTNMHPGVIYIRDSTTIAGGYRYGCAGSQLIGGGEYFELIFQPVGVRNNQTAKFGWSDSAAPYTLPVDGVFFNVSSADGATILIRGNTSSNSAHSGTASAYTATTATWYKGTIVLNSDATLATYTLYNENGASVWTDTVSTNIPTGAGRDTSPCIAAAQGSTDAAADILRLDYVKWGSKRSMIR